MRNPPIEGGDRGYDALGSQGAPRGPAGASDVGVATTMRLTRILVLAALATLSLAAPAHAQEPRRLTHYAHQRWIEGSEAPVPVVAMAQGHSELLR